MTNHHAPFQSAAHLPADLAIGAWLVYGALLGIGWDHARPHVAHWLTTWGQRLT